MNTNQELLEEFEVIETGSKFISKNFQHLQKEFGDKFIAIKENEILSNARSFEEVLKKVNALKEIPQNKIIIQFIPAKGEIILY
jgi:heme oxygenase